MKVSRFTLGLIVLYLFVSANQLAYNAYTMNRQLLELRWLLTHCSLDR